MIQDQHRGTYRVLMIAPMVPIPPDDGGRVEILNMVHYLQRSGHEVVFFAPRTRANDSATFSQDVELHLIDLDPQSSLRGRLRHVFDPLPYSAQKFFSRQSENEVIALSSGRNFDVVHVENLYMMRLGTSLGRRYRLPVVLHQHNLESEILERYYQQTRNPLVRCYARYEYLKTLAFEREMMRQCDLVFAISQENKRKIIDFAPGVNCVVLPPGVNLEFLKYNHQSIPERLLFLTNFGWIPNRDSYEYYCREIHPVLSARIPSLKTLVVGKHLDEVGPKKPKSNVEFHGFIPDLNEASSLASVAIVPLRIGSGVRVKILELMAMGVVVVSTSLGAEGIAAKNGEHLIIADDPETMSQEIERLLNDPDGTRRIAVAARKFVEANHSESAVGSIVDTSYRALQGWQPGAPRTS